MAAKHMRQQIRESVAKILDAKPDNWQRVFKQREALARSVMPYLLVYTPNEPSQPLTLHQPFLLQRDLNLIVQGHVRLSNPEDVEELFDTLALEVEQKLTLAKLKAEVAKISGLVLLNTQSDIVINDAAERMYGELTMTWQVQYHTTEGNPV